MRFKNIKLTIKFSLVLSHFIKVLKPFLLEALFTHDATYHSCVTRINRLINSHDLENRHLR